MQNHDDTIKTSDTVLRKIYLSLYLKRLCVRGSWRPNRTATYWPPLLWPHRRFFPVLLGCSAGGLGAQPLWNMFLNPASYLQLVWSPNWLNFLCTELCNSSRPPSSCGRHKSHSFNPSTVKVIFWYSSTGSTCYLHRCISYFWQPNRVVGQYTTIIPYLFFKIPHVEFSSRPSPSPSHTHFTK